MKRSAINRIVREAKAAFASAGWHLPPEPRWDVTDFGRGDFDCCGLLLVNLAEEPEYCEKLMYAREGQLTPMHTHRLKKEDIIARHGRLALELWPGPPAEKLRGERFRVSVNGGPRELEAGGLLVLEAGERVTLTPGIYHAFRPEGGPCVIGEVSTANDDLNDNIFADPDIGRFPGVEEDEPAEVRLVSDRPATGPGGARHG
ncbi:MAG: D-lyxose/D-mannose family sugar isomerase [Puniceicoccaceae bacterium]|nr:MAG: D-lyxose/D-mannose family sugar isomerase [Puniceicoccaceae bacterium]